MGEAFLVNCNKNSSAQLTVVTDWENIDTINNVYFLRAEYTDDGMLYGMYNALIVNGSVANAFFSGDAYNVNRVIVEVTPTDITLTTDDYYENDGWSFVRLYQLA